MGPHRVGNAVPREVVRATLAWRRTPTGGVEIHHPRSGRWHGYLPWTAAVLEALDEGVPYAGILERVRKDPPSGDPEARLRVFLYGLAGEGFVHLRWDDPPATFHGRYVRLGELGRGGAGVAYLARDAATGREVVVKRAWDFLAPLAVADRLLAEEAEVLRRLDHPSVVALLDSFDEDGRAHLVREHAAGTPLHRAAGSGLEDAAALLRVADGVADALAHLHARGLLLLDVAPGNFVVDAAWTRPRLIDVGTCRPLVDGTVAVPRAVGSPPYAAPEAREARRADVRADVYGLGRLLYTVATGRVPRPRAALADLPPPPDARLSEALVRVAAEDVAARPPDVEAARALLRAALTGR